MIPPSVPAWVRKAESDLKVARDELATAEPATDAVCFHCQQCAEKYLKAFLVCHQREIPRTHNIAELLVQCISIDLRFQSLLESDAPSLTLYAVAVRYPSDDPFPTLEEALEALSLATHVRDMVRLCLAEAGCGPNQ
ncbi:HEPN domain-containing protein [Chloroflexus sp.]|uniref:HEPN domain-containing protein n=1 Tax=Chloroflexus sp. TaxID=1904827 RepID=UPI0029F98D0E|nr:HEPN domain-containing protein [Chloroflexus sp.]MCS6886878.1 HEPN domain-containing protein [Chloroflexus sp.]